MWIFYYGVGEPVSQTAVGEASMFFAGMVLLTGIIIMAPSYFERRRQR